MYYKFNLNIYAMKDQQKNNTDPIKKNQDNRPDNKDNLDSRVHEEQKAKGDDVTSNEKETKNKK